MCGLAGMVGYDIQKEHREMFTTLFGVTYLRGHHSTGLFTAQPLAKKDTMKLKRMTTASPNFIKTDLSERNGSLLSDPWADLLMGHCRSATVGEVTKENSHPFDTPSLVGAHNGTLHDYWSWGLKNTPDVDKTDSQIMFNRMHEKGVEEVLKDMMPNSAWALSIYMKKTKKLILARNKHRPLYVSFVKDAGVMYWSSEVEMVEFAAARHDIEVTTYHLEKNKMYVIDPFEVRKGNISPWTIVDVPEKTYTAHTVFKTGGGTWEDDVKNTAIKDTDLSNEQCCTCDRQLTVKDVNNLTPVNVDGVKYFCCEVCSQESREKLKKEIEKEQVKPKSFVDAYGHPLN
jgi:glucosamine 6-phosphate synthetase-like amidotransferase/phosphosugar isomerase protein